MEVRKVRAGRRRGGRPNMHKWTRDGVEWGGGGEDVNTKPAPSLQLWTPENEASQGGCI